jgi:hypothetical protein
MDDYGNKEKAERFHLISDAFVSIPYRNSYFWIDDRDMRSKKIFSFLMFVFTLVETGEKGAAPIVTIPTG